MNDLQITLLVVGGGGIVGMIAYNWWQDHRVRKQATERFGASDADPLFEDVKTEPGMGFGLDSENTVADEVIDNPVQTGHDKSLFADFIVQFDEPLHCSSIKPLIDTLTQSHNKRILISVSPSINTDDEEIVWFDGERYQGDLSLLRVSPQLANRKGALTSIEFSNLLSRVRKFAEDKNGDLQFPEMKKVVSKAETLDQAAAALDTLLGLHCMLPEDIPEAAVIDSLTVAGWKSKGHQWHLNNEQGKLASMVIHKAPGKKLLSFNIDVPNSVDPIQALGDIVTVCHGFNQQFAAPLIDDSGRTLTTEAIDSIYEHLMERVRNLTDSGYKPGSSLAQALFS